LRNRPKGDDKAVLFSGHFPGAVNISCYQNVLNSWRVRNMQETGALDVDGWRWAWAWIPSSNTVRGGAAGIFAWPVAPPQTSWNC
jgi:hypothetical protein